MQATQVQLMCHGFRKLDSSELNNFKNNQQPIDEN